MVSNQQNPEPDPLPECPKIDPLPGCPKRLWLQALHHREIRNDPDYDDWEYGTEPLIGETWRPNQ